MPTYTWTRTRDQLRDMVLRKLGVLGATGAAEAEDAALVQEAMDARLKELHVLGVLWWNVSGAATSLTITSGSNTTTIAAADYLYPVSLMLTVGGTERPVEIIDHRQWQAITNKAATGDPEQAFFSGSTVYLYPVPNTTTTAKLTYQATAADTEPNVAPDVRVESMRALSVIVAADLIDEYGITEPKASRLLVQQREALKTIRMLNQQRVDTAVVAPDWF